MRIYAGVFYSWVSKLKKDEYNFLNYNLGQTTLSYLQDVVRVNMIDYGSTSYIIVEQNTSILTSTSTGTIVAELLVVNITLSLYNDANERKL